MFSMHFARPTRSMGNQVRLRLPRLVSRMLVFIAIILSLNTRGPDAQAQNFSSIQSGTSRPFVIGLVPVIGSRGGVGGVSVDAKGVVQRVDVALESRLQAQWKRKSSVPDQAIELETDFRVISLARLDRELERLLDANQPMTQEMIFLAGLQRVQYVLAVPDRKDVLLAGPAGGWKANEMGEVVGTESGRAVLRLDDLMDALRCAGGIHGDPIRCSIEPTAAGLQRFAQMKTNLRTFSPRALRSMESALGDQQVLIDGIGRDTHFAHVMLAADVMMKRFAMGFEPSLVEGFSSYLQMLQDARQEPESASPRWWMAAQYDRLSCSEDRLSWKIQGQGIQTKTESGQLEADGQRGADHRESPIAQAWADAMTAHFDKLSTQRPIFGQLRNCMDLAVVAALMENEDLLFRSGCDLKVLMNAELLRGPQLHPAKTIPSKASSLRSGRGWIVTVSGGVEMDVFPVVSRWKNDDSMDEIREKATNRTVADRWWW